MPSQTLDPARAAYDALERDLILRHPGISAGKLFGVACIKANGKTFAAFHQGGAAFKLGGEQLRAALALAGAHLWDPSGRARPMRQWAHVPFEHAAAWPQLAEQSLACIAA